MGGENRAAYESTVNPTTDTNVLFPKDKGLRRTWEENGIWGEGLDSYYYSDMNQKGMSKEELHKLSSENFYDNGLFPENNYLIDNIMYDTIYNLVDSQKVAAASVGFNSLGSRTNKYDEDSPMYWKDDDRQQWRLSDDNTQHSRGYNAHYLDPQFFPIARTADELAIGKNCGSK